MKLNKIPEEYKQASQIIVSIVAKVTNITYSEMNLRGALGELSRKRSRVDARQLVYVIATRHHKMSTTVAGAIFGQDHATVLNAVKNQDNLTDTSKKHRINYSLALREYKEAGLAKVDDDIIPRTYLIELVDQIQALQKRVQYLEQHIN